MERRLFGFRLNLIAVALLAAASTLVGFVFHTEYAFWFGFGVSAAAIFV